MENKRLSTLPEVTDPRSTDWFYLVRGGVSKKVSYANLVEFTGGEGVFIVDNSAVRVTAEDATDVTMTNASGESGIEFAHSTLTAKMLHSPFQYIQNTDPTLDEENTVLANESWLDTANDFWMLRNSDNDAWIGL